MSNPSSELAPRPNSGRPAWGSGDGLDPAAVEANEEPLIPSEPKGCWANFTSCIGGMWATRQMTKSGDREIYIRTTVRELVVYIIFLVVLCLLTFGMTSPMMYYYTKVMSELFLDSTFNGESTTFRSSTQMNDFWKFSQSTLLDGLYWEYWYENKQPVYNASEEDQNILYENRLLGVPRLRQVKVRNDSCSVHDDFAKAIRVCYNVYSEHIEDTEPFGIGNGSAWTYHTEKQLDGSSHWGILASYAGGGSYMDLGLDRTTTEGKLKVLKENLWIQRGTRAVFLDFTVYNANINLFCVIRLVFEFPATGGVIPSWSFRTVKLLRYVTAFDFFIMACEFIFAIFICYYIIEESIEIHKNKCSYFKSIWNILDIVVITISVVCIAFSLYRYMLVGRMLKSLLADPAIFADFEFLGFWQMQFNNAVAMCVFFAWIKLFKYISFNKTMTQLSSTLSRCAKDVAGFAVMFFIVFFAFAQLGYLLFGTQVKDFSSFGDSVFTLLRTILGDFNFHEIENANRVLGPIFFLAYVFFVFFVLLNMFLAIINDTYSEVKAEIAAQKNEFEIADYFKRGYNNVLGKMGKRDKLIDIENALKLANSDGQVTYDEIRQSLRKCNFSDLEIEMFFSRYDLDGDRNFGENETRRVLADLEGEKMDLDREIKAEQEKTVSSRPATATSGRGSISGVSLEDFSVLQRRVDRMEHSIGSIVSKIDAVLVKMESMEKGKQKRRETMSKILDTITENDAADDATKREQMEKLVREELNRWDSDGSTRPNTSGSTQ